MVINKNYFSFLKNKNTITSLTKSKQSPREKQNNVYSGLIPFTASFKYVYIIYSNNYTFL